VVDADLHKGSAGLSLISSGDVAAPRAGNFLGKPAPGQFLDATYESYGSRASQSARTALFFRGQEGNFNRVCTRSA